MRSRRFAPRILVSNLRVGSTKKNDGCRHTAAAVGVRHKRKNVTTIRKKEKKMQQLFAPILWHNRKKNYLSHSLIIVLLRDRRVLSDTSTSFSLFLSPVGSSTTHSPSHRLYRGSVVTRAILRAPPQSVSPPIGPCYGRGGGTVGPSIS